MQLSKYKITNFYKRKKGTGKTDFEECISQNNKELFFEYIEHFENKKDIDIFNLDVCSGTYTVLQYAYVCSLFKKDMTLFNFLYNHPKTKIDKESKFHHSLLNIALEHNKLKDFKKFRKDGITESPNHSIFNSWILSGDFGNIKKMDLLSDLLNHFQIKDDQDINIERLINHFYDSRQNIFKTLLFSLYDKITEKFEYHPEKSIYFIKKAIENKDYTTFETLLKKENFRNIFSDPEDYFIDDHPLYIILENPFENKKFFDIYIKNPIDIVNSTENEEFLFDSFFAGIRTHHVNATLPILHYLINDLKLNPCSCSDDNFLTGTFLLLKHSFENRFEPSKFFEIIEKSPYFNINQTTNDIEKDNLLSYIYSYHEEYKSNLTQSKIALKIKNSPDLQFDTYDNPESSLLMTSIAYKDKDLFQKCMTNINYKNKKDIFSHLFKHSYSQLFLLNLLSNKEDLSFLINDSISFIIQSDSNKQKNISQAIIQFREQCEKALLKVSPPKGKEELKNNLTYILSMSEKTILENSIKLNQNTSVPQQNKRRI